MKQNLKIRINKYITGATGPNRTGIFARVAHGIVPVNFGLGEDFNSCFTPLK